MKELYALRVQWGDENDAGDEEKDEKDETAQGAVGSPTMHALVPTTKSSVVKTSLLPREVVSELDRFIVGQTQAKRAVAIALRNRWRRMQVSKKMRGEIVPKNILMVGPTGIFFAFFFSGWNGRIKMIQ